MPLSFGGIDKAMASKANSSFSNMDPTQVVNEYKPNSISFTC